MWSIQNNLVTSSIFSKVRQFTTLKNAGDLKSKEKMDKLFNAISLTGNQLVTAQQIHGNKVAVIDSKDRGKQIEGVDGLLTSREDIMLGIFTADCMPVFISDMPGNSIGLLHVGWKGLAKQLLENGLDMFLKSYNVPKDEVLIGIGPHICGKCYKVDKSFKKIFRHGYKDEHMDMESETLSRLKSMKIKMSNVDCADMDNYCTFHNSNDFYSYRNGDRDKRLLSVIGLK